MIFNKRNSDAADINRTSHTISLFLVTNFLVYMYLSIPQNITFYNIFVHIKRQTNKPADVFHKTQNLILTMYAICPLSWRLKTADPMPRKGCVKSVNASLLDNTAWKTKNTAINFLFKMNYFESILSENVNVNDGIFQGNFHAINYIYIVHRFIVPIKICRMYIFLNFDYLYLYIESTSFNLLQFKID